MGACGSENKNKQFDSLTSHECVPFGLQYCNMLYTMNDTVWFVQVHFIWMAFHFVYIKAISEINEQNRWNRNAKPWHSIHIVWIDWCFIASSVRIELTCRPIRWPVLFGVGERSDPYKSLSADALSGSFNTCHSHHIPIVCTSSTTQNVNGLLNMRVVFYIQGEWFIEVNKTTTKMDSENKTSTHSVRFGWNANDTKSDGRTKEQIDL